MNRAYQAIQAEKRNPMEERTWSVVVRDAGINPNAFVRAWNSLGDASDLVRPSVVRADHYQLEVTPSIAIDGRYLISPDNTQGNPELFIQLLNGMISKAAGYA